MVQEQGQAKDAALGYERLGVDVIQSKSQNDTACGDQRAFLGKNRFAMQQESYLSV